MKLRKADRTGRKAPWLRAGACHLLAVVSCLVVLPALAAGQTPNFGNVGLYQTYWDMVYWAYGFRDANPDLVGVYEFGRSVENRPLIALKVSWNPGTNSQYKPEFLITAGLHAREVVTSHAACKLAEHLVQGFRNGDPGIVDSLMEREVWIVPNLNPDGRGLVQAGDSTVRKNAQGVDLNRNFPHRWQDAPDSPGAEDYGGPSVLSTPEAGALWSFVHNPVYFGDLRAAIDFHSGAQTILAPWVSPSDRAANPLPPADRAKFDALTSRMSQLTGWGTQPLWYDSYGTLADSLYESLGTYSMLEEIYGAPFYDYFTYFNPLDQETLDDTVNKAIASAAFLLSDEAFLITPEPASAGMLIACLAGVVFRRRAR